MHKNKRYFIWHHNNLWGSFYESFKLKNFWPFYRRTWTNNAWKMSQKLWRLLYLWTSWSTGPSFNFVCTQENLRWRPKGSYMNATIFFFIGKTFTTWITEISNGSHLIKHTPSYKVHSNFAVNHCPRSFLTTLVRTVD